MVPQESPVVFRIDRDDRIQFVSPEWIQFAEENGGKGLRSEDVIGRVLWRYIAGEEVRYLYRLLFSRVRGDGRARTIPFRCDGPFVRRFMELRVSLSEEEGLVLAGTLQRSEPRGEVPLLDMGMPRTGESQAICAVCKRLPVEGEWLEVEAAIVALDLFEAAFLPHLTNVICPDCLGAFGDGRGGEDSEDGVDRLST
jgi:hypothetical protein